MEAQAALTWNDLPARVELPKMPFEALLSTCQFLAKNFGQQKTNVVGSSGKCTFSRCLATAGDHLESNQRKLCLRQILFNLMLLATSELPILMSEKFFGEKTLF